MSSLEYPTRGVQNVDQEPYRGWVNLEYHLYVKCVLILLASLLQPGFGILYLPRIADPTDQASCCPMRYASTTVETAMPNPEGIEEMKANVR